MCWGGGGGGVGLTMLHSGFLKSMVGLSNSLKYSINVILS